MSSLVVPSQLSYLSFVGLLEKKANYTSAQTTTAILTGTAGQIIVLSSCSAMLSNASTVNVAVDIFFGTGSAVGTTKNALSHPGLAAGSGVVELASVGASGDGVYVTCGVPTTGSLTVLLKYWIING
jgi:hypothetical protein